jgi:hypothetical protein
MTNNARPETSSGILVIRRGDLSAIECILPAQEKLTMGEHSQIRRLSRKTATFNAISGNGKQIGPGENLLADQTNGLTEMSDKSPLL